MAAAPLSPSSSPRLPSPPPIVEDQLGPQSPAIAASDEQQKLVEQMEQGSARRIRPGTKAEDMAEGPPLVELAKIESAFQLTEYLKSLHQHLTHPSSVDGSIAVDREIALKLAEPPENVERTLWLYELCRFLTQKVNSVITALFSDDPPCSSVTCPEMRASEWQYLCAVHDPPKACCAIDYCCHTLDWAANTLTSTKTFPSRLALDANQQHQQIRHLTNIFRRVYRIFAHAWFQHRDVFWKVEGRTGLYILFKTVCDSYGLIPEDNYTIPPEAEGLESSQAAPPMILRREPSGPGAQEQETPSIVEGVTEHTLSTAGTTKRHRHSPSVGANAVHTVVEESEEDVGGSPKESSVVSVVHVETPEEGSKGASEEKPVSTESVPEDSSTDEPKPEEPTSEEPKSEEPASEKTTSAEPSLHRPSESAENGDSQAAPMTLPEKVQAEEKSHEGDAEHENTPEQTDEKETKPVEQKGSVEPEAKDADAAEKTYAEAASDAEESSSAADPEKSKQSPDSKTSVEASDTKEPEEKSETEDKDTKSDEKGKPEEKKVSAD